MKRASGLVVDAGEAMRTLLVRALRCLPDTGLELVEPANDEEALADTARVPAGLVLLGRSMPLPRGIEFLRRARAVETYQRLPIVPISNEGAGEQVEAALEVGAPSYVAKPSSPEALRDTGLDLLEYARA